MTFGRNLRIVIPGGSGHTGRLLATWFQQSGHLVTVLTRSPFAAPYQTVYWDGVTPGAWVEALEDADVCINLSGQSVNTRSTPANRRILYQSRIHTTHLLGHVIGGLASPPRLWMNASTATIYRHSLDRDMDEHTGEIGGSEMISRRRRAPETWNFSIRLARDWEASLFSSFTPRTRKVALRTAIVMNPVPGGAFALLLRLVRFSLGGAQGSGRQFVSWIHAIDFARAVEFLVQHDDLDGVVNLAAPCPVPNREFMEALREAYGMPNGLPAPTPLIELAALVLRTESELVLKSRRVVPARLLEAGFNFQHPEWREAAEDLVRRWRNRP